MYPTWPSGKFKSYVSADCPSTSSNLQQENSAAGSSFNAFNASMETHSTPVKNRSSSSVTSSHQRRHRNETNTCALCNVEFESLADEKLNSCWVQCSKNCGYWVLLLVVEFITKMMTVVKKIWQSGQKITFSVQNIYA